MADNRRKTANGTRTRYKYQSKTDEGGERLKPDRGRNLSARVYAAKMLMDEHTREEIVDALMEKFDYSESMAGDIFNRARKTVEGKLQEKCAEVANINYLRLEAIIDNAMDNGVSKTAIEAIDKQNKMVGIYEQKINVQTNEPVKIEFN